MRKRDYRGEVSREIRRAEIRTNRLVRNGREYKAQWLNLFGNSSPVSNDREEREDEATTFRPF